MSRKQGDDRVVWELGRRRFTVKSLHNAVRLKSPVWCFKLPAKIKIFLWLLMCGRTLTKDILVEEGEMDLGNTCFVLLMKA